VGSTNTGTTEILYANTVIAVGGIVGLSFEPTVAVKKSPFVVIYGSCIRNQGDRYQLVKA
jgi:hypothetical protein